jgi:hypothetical protein
MSHLFPSASVGRAAGRRASSSPSTDDTNTLSPSSGAHPLLGGSSTSHQSAANASSSSSSPEAPLSPNLPYQPRRRTPGGSIASINSLSSQHTTNSHNNKSTVSPPTAITARDPPSSGPPISLPSPSAIPPLFSNPVVPITSTSNLDSSSSNPTTPTTTSAASTSRATTMRTVSGGSTGGGGGSSLTGRLQLTNLKAEAQKNVGLGNESLGMKMLETLVHKGGEKEWESVLDLVLGKKVHHLPCACPSTEKDPRSYIEGRQLTQVYLRSFR